MDSMNDLPDQMLDEMFDLFLDSAEQTMLAGGLVNPYVLIHYSDENGNPDLSYIEAQGLDNDHLEDFYDRLHRIGRKMIRKNQHPFMVMFCAPGHAERLEVADLTRLEQVQRDVKQRRLQDKQPDDTIMAATLVVDQRQRASITFFSTPPDGGLVIHKRHAVNGLTSFLLSGKMDVFGLCSAVFAGAAQGIDERDGNNKDDPG